MKFDEFDIAEGEHLAIVGNNGAGKTTLVEGLMRRWPRRIEYISFRDTYGDEADGAYYLQLRWNRQDLANHIELEGEAMDMFSLSSGELRKHRIARALKSDCPFLVIDNPYLGLDAESRDVFNLTLGQIAAEGSRTVILVMPGADILPDFVTHVALVSAQGVEEMPVEAFLAAYSGRKLEDLPEERRSAILDFPHKDLSTVRFYPSSENAEIVRCNSVSIRYDDRTILDSLDWTVREGES